MLVEVALPVPVRTSFTYEVPEELRTAAVRGARVRVPFGARKMVGVVLGPAPDAALGPGIKEIEAVLDPEPMFPAPVLDLASWIASYYHAPIGEALRMALPPRGSGEARAVEAARPTARSGHGSEVRLVRLAPGIEAGALALDRRASRLRAILDFLAASAGDSGWIRVEVLRGACGASADHLRVLQARRWIEIASTTFAPQSSGPTGADARGGWTPDANGSWTPDQAAQHDRHVPREAGGDRPDEQGDPAGAEPLTGASSASAARVDGPAARGHAAGAEPLAGASAASAARDGRPAEHGHAAGAEPIMGAARATRSDPGLTPAPGPGPELTVLQAAAASAIIAAIDASESAIFVLRGVTGSGKTEVYFTAARRALDRGRGVIFLVPEIGLTPVFARSVRERFGEQVAILHSRLSARERQQAWMRVKEGRAPLVVGPRSALFAPVTRLGLVVVDEEHDPSYKQEETPRYHARDIALVRARMEGAVAVLGSATPSLESWHAAVGGRYRKIEMGERIGRRPLPAVEIVDMREEFRRRGAPVLLSSALTGALLQAKERGEQSVILLNRRGYAAFALCRACGEPVGCTQCSVSLVYHRSDETLRCHYCDHRRPRPEACPGCASPHLVFQGEGTERVERHIERELPGMRVVRLDRDTARAHGAHERILGEFEQGHFDILVGTQMVAKGHDFPSVTVVGVLAADAILGFPDFRAAERTFQLLTQVAGRAGRGDRPGRVLVQAYRKEHYALATAVLHDHEGFYRKEILYRRTLGYPPFTNLAVVTVFGKDLSRASQRARDVAARLQAHGAGRVQVLGPALAPIARLRGAFRFQILLKARAKRRLGDALEKTLQEMSTDKGGTRDLIVDVDPQQLL